MALLGKGVNQTKYDQGNTPSDGNVINAGMRGAEVLCCIDSYTAVLADAAGSTYEMQTPPVGARIVGMEFFNTSTESGLVIDVGDGETATRYITDAAITTNTRMDRGLGYVIGTVALDDQILLTTGVAAVAVDDVFTLAVYYTLGGDSD